MITPCSGAPTPPRTWAGVESEALRRDWGVNDRAELLKMLTWLALEGHRKDFNEVCGFDLQVSARLGPEGVLEDVVDDQALLKSIHFSRRHRARVGTRSLLAWDMARLIMLAGWGYLLQWLSKGEAWSYVLPAAQAVQHAYGSWEELGQHHLLGREYWANEWVAHHARAFRALLDDPVSPWRTLAWNTDLRQPNRLIPLQEIVVEAPPPPGPLARMRRSFAPEGAVPATESKAKPTPGAGNEPAATNEGEFWKESNHLSPPATASQSSGRTTVIILAVVLTFAIVVTALALARKHSTSPARSVPAGAAPAPKPGTTPAIEKR